VFVWINDNLCYLWCAVDQHGNVLDVLGAVTAKRGVGQAILPQVA
jgi:transposase-like protein